MLPKHLGGRRVIFGGHDDDGASVPPFLFERKDLIRHRQGAVNEDAVGPRQTIGFGSTQGFREPPATDEGLHSGNNGKVRVGPASFSCLDLAAELRMSARVGFPL